MRTTKLLLLIAISIIFAQCAYANLDDKSDRLSNDQSNTFSPGYINATMQKTQAIINQVNGSGNIMRKTDNSTDYMDNDLARDVNKAAADTPKVQLQKKTGGGESSNNKVQPQAAAKVAFATDANTNINIGTGTNQEKDANGRLIAEVIDGKRYVYAGFDNVGYDTGQLQNAINFAGVGDTVVLRGGKGYAGTVVSGQNTLYLKDGVSIYGGYNEDGGRDLVGSATTINAMLIGSNMTNRVEINGLSFYVSPGTRTNNINFGIYVQNSTNIVLNNNRSENCYCLLNASSSSITASNNIIVNDRLSFYFQRNEYQQTALLTNNDITGIHVEGRMAVTSINNNISGVVGLSGYAGVGSMASFSSTSDYYSNPGKISVAGTGHETVSLANQQSSAYAISLPKSLVIADSAPSTNARTLSSTFYIDNPNNSVNVLGVSTNTLNSLSNINASGSNALGSILKGLLANKSSLQQDATVGVDPKLLARITEDSLEKSALSLSMGQVTQDQINIASILASILKNPTSDQKLILDTMMSLLNDVNRSQDEKSQSPEVKKAQDDLLQVVANILIAQAIPDLLKEGDMSNIKNIFQDMNSQKNKIMLEYNLAVEPYYREVKKLLTRNLALLQLNNIVSKTMVEEELRKMEPNEINKLLDKLRKISNKSFEETYILQEESKLHSKYIDPNKKVFEDKMKRMLEGFTARLSKILEGKK